MISRLIKLLVRNSRWGVNSFDYDDPMNPNHLQIALKSPIYAAVLKMYRCTVTTNRSFASAIISDIELSILIQEMNMILKNIFRC
jgi:hypothetical protein